MEFNGRPARWFIDRLWPVGDRFRIALTKHQNAFPIIQIIGNTLCSRSPYFRTLSSECTPVAACAGALPFPSMVSCGQSNSATASNLARHKAVRSRALCQSRPLLFACKAVRSCWNTSNLRPTSNAYFAVDADRRFIAAGLQYLVRYVFVRV